VTRPQKALAAIAAGLAEAESVKTLAANAVPRAATAAHELELACQRLVQRAAGRRASSPRRNRRNSAPQRRAATGRRGIGAAKVLANGNVWAAFRAELGRLADAKRARDGLLAKAHRIAYGARPRAGGGRHLTRQMRGNGYSSGTPSLARHALPRRRPPKRGRGLADTVHANQWPGWDEAAAGTEEAWLTTIAARLREITKVPLQSIPRSPHKRAHSLADLNSPMRAARGMRRQSARRTSQANLASSSWPIHFRSYLLEEAIRTLAGGRLASSQRTLGRPVYVLHRGAEFQIVDSWNADEASFR